MPSPFSLDGKVAIVTGSGQGIGESTAIAMAEAGADVVLAGINLEDRFKHRAELEAVASRIVALGRRALVVPTDVRVSDEVNAMVQKSCSEFGRIDILVNNAGSNFFAPFLDISEGGWTAIVRENLMSTVICCKTVGKIMIEQKKGCIINTSSTFGIGPSPESVHYGATKAAIANLTQSLSIEWAPFNIRVNAVAPGMIMTPSMVVSMKSRREWFERIAAWTPMGRAGRPEEVAWVSVFLASDASSYITGKVIEVDGGNRGYGGI